jgi:cell division protein ZipA
MWELRWVLVGLGAALIAGMYLWGRGTFKRLLPEREQVKRWMPAHSDADDPWATPMPTDSELIESEANDADVSPPSATPDRIITIRFVAKNKELSCGKVILALRAAGMQHGRYGIFHRVGNAGTDDPLFSVANLTEPGSFDLSNLEKSTIPGMSFFMTLPGSGDPVTAFDLMVETARSLAHDLDAELHDEKGSSWSIQRERYLREEIIEYRHQRARV